MSRVADWEERWERRRAKWRRERAAENRQIAAELRQQRALRAEIKRQIAAGEIPSVPPSLVIGCAVWLLMVFGGYLR